VSASGGATGPADLDRVVHEPARLLIMTNLFVVDSADATWLLQQTGLTWGNIASHLRKLEESGYVTVAKSFKGRKPRTTLSLTDAGRNALLDYRERMLGTLSPMDPPAGQDPRFEG
jgi:DNA-binding MarR family transcriptional regulator